MSRGMPSSGGAPRRRAAGTIQAGMPAETVAGRLIAMPGNLSRDVAMIRPECMTQPGNALRKSLKG